jgi:hypothetical protein
MEKKRSVDALASKSLRAKSSDDVPIAISGTLMKGKGRV